MKSTIDNPEIPEDVKAKHYEQNLRRFLNIKCELAVELLVDLTTTVNDVLDIKTTTPDKKRWKRKKKESTEKWASSRIRSKP
jgi:hypothetical protein